jgi:hypothetical protein
LTSLQKKPMKNHAKYTIIDSLLSFAQLYNNRLFAMLVKSFEFAAEEERLHTSNYSFVY